MKKILITGVSRGLGLEIAKNILDKNYFVVGTSRNINPQIDKLLNSENFSYESFDFNEVKEIKNFSSNLIKKYGRFYGLINNAAVGNDGILGTMHDTEISETIRVNIEAPILLTKYISRSMLLNQEGRLINISSIIASTGFNGLSVYAASKASLIGFTKSLSRELGKGNITVNTVSPGYMSTDMTSKLGSDKLDKIIRRSPMNRLVSPKEILGIITFLLSKESAMITGQDIIIDAGSTA